MQRRTRPAYVFSDRTARPWCPPREAAWALVCEFVQSDSLRKHMRCVEQAMRAYAREIRRRMWNTGASRA